MNEQGNPQIFSLGTPPPPGRDDLACDHETIEWPRAMRGVRWLQARGDQPEGASIQCWGPYGGFHHAHVVDGLVLPEDGLFEEWCGIHRSNPASLFAVGSDQQRRGTPTAITWGRLPLREAVRLAREIGGQRPTRIVIPKPPSTIAEFLASQPGWTSETMASLDSAARYADRNYGDFPNRHAWLFRMNRVCSEADGEGSIAFHALSLTRTLEFWGETCIKSLPQALSYAVSMHAEWRRAGLEWLAPHRLTWLRNHQLNCEVVDVARRHAGLGLELPGWLTRRRLSPVPLYPPLAEDGTPAQHYAAYRASFVRHRTLCATTTDRIVIDRPGARAVRFDDDRRMTCKLDLLLEAGCISDARERALCSAELLESANEVTGDPERPEVTIGAVDCRRILKAHGGLWSGHCELPSRSRTVRDVPPRRLQDPVLMEWVLHDSEVFALANEPDYWNRHDSLLEYVGGTGYGSEHGCGPLAKALAITLVLDAWAETRLESLPVAVAYAHSLVPRWRRVALKWLKPHGAVFYPQYLRDRPELPGLTRSVAEVVDDLPRWFRCPDERAPHEEERAWRRGLN